MSNFWDYYFKLNQEDKVKNLSILTNSLQQVKQQLAADVNNEDKQAENFLSPQQQRILKIHAALFTDQPFKEYETKESMVISLARSTQTTWGLFIKSFKEARGWLMLASMLGVFFAVSVEKKNPQLFIIGFLTLVAVFVLAEFWRANQRKPMVDHSEIVRFYQKDIDERIKSIKEIITLKALDNNPKALKKEIKEKFDTYQQSKNNPQEGNSEPPNAGYTIYEFEIQRQKNQLKTTLQRMIRHGCSMINSEGLKKINDDYKKALQSADHEYRIELEKEDRRKKQEITKARADCRAQAQTDKNKKTEDHRRKINLLTIRLEQAAIVDKFIQRHKADLVKTNPTDIEALQIAITKELQTEFDQFSKLSTITSTSQGNQS
ncbi:MAG: hypothetical protein ACH34X_19365 [Thiolinea sp.]